MNEYTSNILIVVFVGLALAVVAFVPSILVWTKHWHVPEYIVAKK